MAAEALPATLRTPAPAATRENVIAGGDDKALLLGTQADFQVVLMA